MAVRSTKISVTNNSDVEIWRIWAELLHGIWTTQPPLAIRPGTTAVWESESDGVGTGTEGLVRYRIHFGRGMSTGGTVELRWNNPYLGSNSYSETVPLPGYKATRSGGSGNNTTVYWTFDCTSKTGDGIPDDWKRNGVTIDGEFINLPAMGATVDKPDLFIQADWMEDFGATTAHTHKLSNTAIKKLIKAFADSPYVSRSGSVGINLHIDAGSDSTLDMSANTTWGSLSKARQLPEVAQLGTGGINDYRFNATNPNTGATDPGTFFDTIKSESGGFTSTGRGAIFRYCIIAHGISTLANSGIARDIPGSDFIMSLAATCGNFPTDDQQAHTIMHELGHCLGLFHGGGEDINYKPNYVSIMNYPFQFPGLTRGTTSNICDYSNVALDPLDENHLDETKGVGAAATNVTITKYDPVIGMRVFVADGSLPIDWDGDPTTTKTDFAFNATNAQNLTKLEPYNDWENLKLRGGAIGAGGAYEPPKVVRVNEITPEDLAKILPMDTTPPVTTAVVTPPANAAGWNNEAVTVKLTATDDISGVAGTFYQFEGFGVSTYTGPTTFTMEGISVMKYHSVDRSQNREVPKELTFRIDRTPPEAFITYDAATHQIVVTGRDALSGPAAGDNNPVQPSSVKPVSWTEFGSDCAEDRRYRILDRADNVLELYMRVRCEPDEYDFSVTGLRYNGSKEVKRPERNTVVYRRLRGRVCRCGHDGKHGKKGAKGCKCGGGGGPLLGVLQRVALGQGMARESVQWTWDALGGRTEERRWVGCLCCGGRAKGCKRNVKGDGEHSQKPDAKTKHGKHKAAHKHAQAQEDKAEKTGHGHDGQETGHDKDKGDKDHDDPISECDGSDGGSDDDEKEEAIHVKIVHECGIKVLGLGTHKGDLKLEP